MSDVIRPTEEQAAALRLARQGSDLVINAFAGTGKSTTLNLIAQSHPARNISLLAFNRAIAQHAQQHMSGKVNATTFNARALHAMRQVFDRSRLDQMLSPSHIVEFLGIYDAIPCGKLLISPAMQAQLVIMTLANFGKTLSTRLVPRDVGRIKDLLSATLGVKGESEAVRLADMEIHDLTRRRAERVWTEMCDPRGVLPVTHDVYVKLWALDEPTIESDLILFDEAQDIDPLMLHVISQQDAQIISVGDRYQQIYAWRGAVNALANIGDGKVCYLTESFRFGENVAQQANRLLRSLGESRDLQGVGPGKYDKSEAILTRTNAGALEVMLSLPQGIRASFSSAKKLMAMTRQIQRIKQGDRVTGGPLSLFQGFDDLVDFANTPYGQELRTVIKLLEEYDYDRLGQVLKNANIPPHEASLSVTTVHQAKGLEWDTVRLHPDWSDPEADEDEQKPFTDEDRCLMYVALTRARMEVNTQDVEKDVLKMTGENTPPCPPEKEATEASKLEVDPGAAPFDRVMRALSRTPRESVAGRVSVTMNPHTALEGLNLSSGSQLKKKSGR